MKSTLQIINICLIISLISLHLSACAEQPSTAGGKSGSILYVDLAFTIDPLKNIFKSRQRITLKADPRNSQRVTFYLNADLLLDSVILKAPDGSVIPSSPYEVNSRNTHEEWWGTYDLNEIELIPGSPIPVDQNFLLEVTYHLPPERIQNGKADNLYELFISTQGSQAGGPESGAFVMTTEKPEAPFTLRITHPSDTFCVAPGDWIRQDSSDEDVTDVFSTEIPYDPSFSCDDYQIHSRNVSGFQIEVYLPTSKPFSEDMLDTAEAIFKIYQNDFGYPSASSFKLAFLDLMDGSSGGESNGNLVLLADYSPYMNFDHNPVARNNFTDLVAHEGVHLWNTWSVDWQGSLSQWWEEGGANFMTARIREKLYGSKEAANLRREYIESFETQQAYLHKDPLANLQDDWFDDWSLVYDYGELVWEQLQQYIGEEALLNTMKEIYQSRQNREISYPEFIETLKHHTTLDVDSFLQQWTRANVKLDVSIRDVQIMDTSDRRTVEIIFQIDTDQPVEIITSIGYKSSSNDQWQYRSLFLDSKNENRISIECIEPISEIQFDPFNRVPQINLLNNYWANIQ